MLKNPKRRSVTITENNYSAICHHRGKFIVEKNKDIDFTTVLNDMLSFAQSRGFKYD